MKQGIDLEIYELSLDHRGSVWLSLLCLLLGHAKIGFHRSGGGYMGGIHNDWNKNQRKVTRFCWRCALPHITYEQIKEPKP